ncbi:uncharacterized protein [Macrobrachium rosenbergii]|uniref:uncharacterized protein n=1 Tax=Macrobrachium rosenbergii TaxID=79674 RepID=UPI0034D45E93
MKALIGWVSRHRVPKIIMSDRGPTPDPVYGMLSRQFGNKDGTHNPEANGIIKRLHQSLKASLTARCQGGSWRKELPWVLLGLRTSPHSSFDASSAESLYEQALTLPGDIFQHLMSLTSPSDICKALEPIMPAKTTYDMAKKLYVPNELLEGKYAFIRVDAHRAPPLASLLGTIPGLPKKKRSLPDDS